MGKIDKQKISKLIRSLIIGRDVRVFDSVSSTNTVLSEIALSDPGEGIVLIADEQTGGRGRGEKNWFSPGGSNIYMSVLFRPDIYPSYSPVFTFIASLALVKTLKGLNFAPEIKWPNDILIKGKKVSGVLTEMRSKEDKLDYIIVGIGLNVNLTEELIKLNLSGEVNKVTSLFLESGKKFGREQVASRLISVLDEYYLKFMRLGTHFIVADWTNKWGKLNEFVSINVSGKVVSGVVRKVDSYGYIYIEKSGGELKKIVAGDMLFGN